MTNPETNQETDYFADITPDEIALLRHHQEITRRLLNQSASDIMALMEQWQREPEPDGKAGLAERLREILRHNAALNDFEATKQGRHIANHDFNTRSLSNWTGEDAKEYDALNQRLFRWAGSRALASIWISNALQPGGDQNLTMREVREDWKARTRNITGEAPSGRYMMVIDADFNGSAALPNRETIRRNGRSLQGWTNMRYDPEAGDAAVRQKQRDSKLGEAICQAGAYPWETTPAEAEKTQTQPPFDGQNLLGALREMNATAREAVRHADDDHSADYLDAASEMSNATAEAARAAEDALRELEAGDDTRAKQYLDRMAHVMGMMSLATHDPAA